MNSKHIIFDNNSNLKHHRYANSESMNVGSLGYILNTLTGGSAERVESESPEMWNKITSSPCNCVIATPRVDYRKKFPHVKIGPDEVTSEGLVLSHVYSVIDWLEKDGVRCAQSLPGSPHSGQNVYGSALLLYSQHRTR